LIKTEIVEKELLQNFKDEFIPFLVKNQYNNKIIDLLKEV
jgi:hypothetical protein